MSEAPSQASYLFEKYSGQGAVDLLKSLPTLSEKTFENDWLDFKSGKTRDEDIKRIWSKIIGAFANNEGGVIVWGLISKKDQVTGIDAVQSVELVPDVFALKSRLIELRHNATDPPIASIDIKELPISTNSTEGFVVCIVPESKSKPHRSEFCEKRFYLRMGDSSKECSVSLLRQLFHPKRYPRLQVEVKVRKRPTGLNLYLAQPAIGPDHIRIIVEISIQNIGEISVDEVYASFNCDGYKLFTYSYSNITHSFDAEPLAAVVNFGTVIHPSLRKSVMVALVNKTSQPLSNWKIQVYARDMMPRNATLPFVSKEDDSADSECLP